MANIWDQTIALSSDTITMLLKTQFNIVVTTLKLIGEGFDNTAFLINDQYVFRFPRRAEALPLIENEIAILPYLAPQLPFALSTPTFIGQPTSAYPYPFAGYPFLPGEILTQAQNTLVDNLTFATTLGTWLRALHQVPVRHSDRAHQPERTNWRLNLTHRTQRVIEVTTQYQKYFVQAGFEIATLQKKMEHFKTLNFENPEASAYIHNDLYAKHILVDAQNMPVALIDWGDCQIGNPAIDLSIGIMILTPELLPHFKKAYGAPSPQDMHIAHFVAYCHAITALSYFAQIEETHTLAWTKAALQNCLALFPKA